MTDIAQRHRLYFYQLLSERLGIGRQVTIGEVEELLVAEEVAPADVGAADVGELLDALAPFVKVTTFRRGRVVVTILRDEALDEALAKIAAESPVRAVPKDKPWRAKASRLVTPEKPPHVARASSAMRGGSRLSVDTASATAPEPRADVDSSSEEASAPTASAPPTPTLKAHVEETAGRRADDAPDEASERTTKPAEPMSQIARSPTSADAPRDRRRTPEQMPVTSAREASITLNITYDPGIGGEGAGSPAKTIDATRQEERRTRREGRQRPPAPTGGSPLHVTSPSTVLALPGRFSDDVRCGDALLLRLCELLPSGVDYLSVLDASWEEARAAMPDPHRPITFPVRLDGHDGPNVTMVRRRPTPSGKRWALVAVDDAREGTGAAVTDP